MALESGNGMEFSVYLGAIDMYVCMYVQYS
jgi:hypothetical protein